MYIVNRIALICVVASLAFIALIQNKRSHWWGPHRSVFEDLSKGELKLLKISGVLSAIAVVFFIIGILFP